MVYLLKDRKSSHRRRLPVVVAPVSDCRVPAHRESLPAPAAGDDPLASRRLETALANEVPARPAADPEGGICARPEVRIPTSMNAGCARAGEIRAGRLTQRVFCLGDAGAPVWKTGL